MDVVSVRVDSKIRKKMKLLSYINWSEVIRKAILQRILEEERKKRRLDPNALLKAMEITDKIRRPSPGWDSTEEIRRWRARRK